METPDRQEEPRRDLTNAERAIENAFNTGKADRAALTRQAQLDAAEAVALVGVAMEADEMADDAMRMSVIARENADQDGIKRARAREREARRQAKTDHKAASKAAKQAYDAIRFSAPNKLGFMRVVQVVFLLHIFSTLLMLWLTSRDAITYNSATLFDWVMIILEGVGFWFFVNQYKIGKPYMIALGGIGIVYRIVVDIASSTFSPAAFFGNASFYLILMLYFIFSKRVDYVMVNDFSKHEGVIEREEVQINRKGWPFYRNLIMYFVIFSVLGHWMEAGMCQFIILGWVQGEYDPSNTMLWRDWLYPFPMEGMAVVIIAVALYPLFKWLQHKFDNKIVPYVASFFANALTCSVIEFTMGLLINSDYKLWDYRDNFGNVMGQVCLQNAVAFGVAASVIAWFVYPLMERWIARLRPEIVNIAFVVIAVFGGILWSLYIIDPPESLTEEQSAQLKLSEQERKAKEAREGYLTSIAVAQGSTEGVQNLVSEWDQLSADERARLNEDLDEIVLRFEDMNATIEGTPSPLDAARAQAEDEARRQAEAAQSEDESENESEDEQDQGSDAEEAADDGYQEAA